MNFLVFYVLLLVAALAVGLGLLVLILNEQSRVRVHMVAAGFPQWFTVERRGLLRRVHLVDLVDRQRKRTARGTLRP